MPEFGASGTGFAIHDAEVNDMATAYAQTGAPYFVVERVDGSLAAAVSHHCRVNPASANCAKCTFYPNCVDAVPARR